MAKQTTSLTIKLSDSQKENIRDFSNKRGFPSMTDYLKNCVNFYELNKGKENSPLNQN